MILGSRASSASVSEQPPGLKSLSGTPSPGSSGEDTAGAAPGLFCAWKTPKLGWVGIKGEQRAERAGRVWGPGGCLGFRDQPGAFCSPPGLCDNPNIDPEKESLSSQGIPCSARGAAAGPSPGDVSQIGAGQQQQGRFGPKSSSAPAPGRCLGSTGISFHANKILEETRSIQVICRTLHHPKWDFRAVVVQQHPARAAQDSGSAAGGAAPAAAQPSDAICCSQLCRET